MPLPSVMEAYRVCARLLWEPHVARRALPRAEELLRPLGMSSAWQQSHDPEVGIVRVSGAYRVADLADTLHAAAQGRALALAAATAPQLTPRSSCGPSPTPSSARWTRHAHGGILASCGDAVLWSWRGWPGSAPCWS